MPHDDHDSSEELLIQEAIAGDKQAFGRLYEMYADRIFSYLYYRSGERSEALDMTEIVFLKAWENLPRFGSQGKGTNFRAWLYRIAHNVMIDRHRTRKEEIPLDALREQPDKKPHAGLLVEQSEQREAVAQALESLDEISRQVLILRFISGLETKEVAKLLGISAGNVRVIQYRGLKKLKELMGEDDE